MNKHTIHSLLALSIIFLIGSQFTFCNGISTLWGVNPSDTFDYDLNYVNIAYSFPFENYTSTGILFDNSTIIEQGNTITMNVNEVNTTTINYNLTYNSFDEKIIRSLTEIETRLSNLMQLPLKIGLREYNLTDIKRGFTGIDYTVVPNINDTWSFFETLSSPIYVLAMEEIFSSQAIVSLEALTELNFTTNDCIFEWFANGTYNDSTQNTTFDFCYNLKMAYQISTGLLLGMRTDLLINGNEENSSSSILIKSEVVKQGYSLADFKLPTGVDFNLDDWLSNILPGYLWVSVPITLILILHIRKKDRK
ncbi:MAG: choice-of-anchor S family protein [Candidatus Thorarchaeota archaeon]